MCNNTKTGEVYTRERCFITELKNDPAVPEVSLARARVAPGVCTELHSLSVLEWYVIESGQGMMRVGDQDPCPVGPGDTISIPPNAPQQITNTGRDVLLFLCVCVPRFTPGCYTSRE
jgi:mannose-6-phosphate isomerase-like protein (cupin superfamily)